LGFLEFLILPQQFTDDCHRSTGNLKVTLTPGDLKGSNQGVGGGWV